MCEKWEPIACVTLVENKYVEKWAKDVENSLYSTIDSELIRRGDIGFHYDNARPLHLLLKIGKAWLGSFDAA